MNKEEQDKLNQDLLNIFKNKHVDVEEVDKLIENGADVNANNGASLIRACKTGHKKNVILLIKIGADIEIDDGAPLIQACLNNHNKIVQILIKEGSEINVKANKGLALISSCHNGYKTIARLLIENGANVNKHSIFGNALESACQQKHIQIVQFLVKNGAKSFYNDLIYICINDYSELSELIINNLDEINIINIKDSYPRKTPIQFACEAENDKIAEILVKILIENGDNINNIVEYHGIEQYNLLLIACKFGCVNLIKLLIDNEVKINIGVEGEPSYIAWQNILKETIKLGSKLENNQTEDSAFNKYFESIKLILNYSDEILISIENIINEFTNIEDLQGSIEQFKTYFNVSRKKPAQHLELKDIVDCEILNPINLDEDLDIVNQDEIA